MTENEAPIHSLGLWNAGDSRFHALLPARDVKNIIKKAYRKGIRAFNTAYSYREAESLLQSAMKELGAKREDYMVFSKVMPVPSMERKTDTILSRLNTSYVDVLSIHWPKEEKELWGALKRLEKIKEEGKAKEIGVSNFPLSLLCKAVKDFPLTVHERALSLLWIKEWEEEKKLGLKTIAYAPGGFGLLSGKYSQENPPHDERRFLEAFSSSFFPSLLSLLSLMSEKYKLTPYEIALSWVEMEAPWAIARGVGRSEDLDVRTALLESEDRATLREAAKKIEKKCQSDNVFNHSWIERK